MRRFGTFLMIAGASLMAGAIAVAFYLANLACALVPAECTSGPVAGFFSLMFSRDGIAFWLLIVVAIVAFRQGRRLRTEGPEVINTNSE